MWNGYGLLCTTRKWLLQYVSVECTVREENTWAPQKSEPHTNTVRLKLVLLYRLVTIWVLHLLYSHFKLFYVFCVVLFCTTVYTTWVISLYSSAEVHSTSQLYSATTSTFCALSNEKPVKWGDVLFRSLHTIDWTTMIDLNTLRCVTKFALFEN